MCWLTQRFLQLFPLLLPLAAAEDAREASPATPDLAKRHIARLPLDIRQKPEASPAPSHPYVNDASSSSCSCSQESSPTLRLARCRIALRPTRQMPWLPVRHH